MLGPFDSFLLIRGIKTLGVRLDRHVENAEKAAAHLKTHPAVKKVYYPGLPEAQGYEIQKRQAKNGGAMISFELDEKYDIRKFSPEGKAGKGIILDEDELRVLRGVLNDLTL